jgi:hypothetical protein
MKYSLMVVQPRRVDFTRGVDDVFVGDVFVDDAAHPFAGGFGREREPA